jgi:hypothetical protein
MEEKMILGRLKLVGAVACVVLLSASQARATIVDCPPASGPDSYSVFLSEPTFAPEAFSTKEQMLGYVQRLYYQLNQKLDNRWIKSPNTEVQLVLCSNRAPTADGQEFVPSLVNSLYTRRVLLEIWGRLDVEPGTGGSATRTAQMNYLLFPFKQAHNENEPAPEALQRLLYREEKGKSVGDFAKLIDPKDIDAFVAAALGFKLLREQTYDLAHLSLCRANALLKGIEKRQPGERTRRDVADLRSFVLKAAASASSKSAVPGLQVKDQPCGD